MKMNIFWLPVREHTAQVKYYSTPGAPEFLSFGSGAGCFSAVFLFLTRLWVLAVIVFVICSVCPVSSLHIYSFEGFVSSPFSVTNRKLEILWETTSPIHSMN